MTYKDWYTIKNQPTDYAFDIACFEIIYNNFILSVILRLILDHWQYLLFSFTVYFVNYLHYLLWCDKR